MALVDLNKVLYVDQDFGTAVEFIQNFLNDNYPDEYNDYVASNLGQALIDIIAYSEQNLAWYLNRKVTDLYFPTAVTPNSVSKISRMLGYKAMGATYSETEIEVTLTKGPYTFPVIISTGFQFKGPNNTIWEYRGNIPVVFAPGETVKSIVIGQGQTVVNNFISDGSNNQIFDLTTVPVGKFASGKSFKVLVNGVEWTEYPAIPYTNTNAYETNILSFPPRLKFGDGVQGNVPPVGAAIEISYVITDGFKGRILRNSISAPVAVLTANFENIPISISQPNNSVGGDDPEDLRSIVVNAPLFQRTQDRAITKGDYDFLCNTFPNVARANADIIRSISGDTVASAYFENILDAISGHGVSAYTAIVSSSQTVSGQIGTTLSSVSSQVNSVNSSVIGFSNDIEVDLGDIDQNASDLVTEVDTVVDVRQANISSLILEINNAVSSASLSVQTQVAALTGSISSNVNGIKTDAQSKTNASLSSIGTLISQITTNLNSIKSSVAGLNSSINSATSGTVTSIYSNLKYISDTALVETGALFREVSGYIYGVSGHFDEHLTATCDGNMVEVRVLGKDVNRKYIDPVSSTLISLKEFLNQRKEITHTLSVISGFQRVIEADIEIQVKASINAVEDDVVNEIRDAISKSNAAPFGILVERQFNESLYIWEIQEAISARVPNSSLRIDHVNIKITGPSKYLDSSGNLVIPNGYVIQLGNLVIKRLPRYSSLIGG